MRAAGGLGDAIARVVVRVGLEDDVSGRRIDPRAIVEGLLRHRQRAIGTVIRDPALDHRGRSRASHVRVIAGNALTCLFMQAEMYANCHSRARRTPCLALLRGG
mgnify:CR=1 FL=1